MCRDSEAGKTDYVIPREKDSCIGRSSPGYFYRIPLGSSAELDSLELDVERFLLALIRINFDYRTSNGRCSYRGIRVESIPIILVYGIRKNEACWGMLQHHCPLNARQLLSINGIWNRTSGKVGVCQCVNKVNSEMSANSHQTEAGYRLRHRDNQNQIENSAKQIFNMNHPMLQSTSYSDFIRHIRTPMARSNKR